MDTFIDVPLLLEFKGFNDGLLLIKLTLINETLKLEISKLLLNWSKWKLDRVVLRTIRHVQYPRYAQSSHPIFDFSLRVSR